MSCHTHETENCITVPMGILAIAFLSFLIHQSTIVFGERSNLVTVKNQQDEIVKQSDAIRTQLDALSVGVLQLSRAGNKNAKVIINRLGELGITVDPSRVKPPTEAVVEKPKR